MEFRSLVVLVLASLTLTTTSAIIPQELYWQSAFPATPMPNSLRDLLPTGHKSSKGNDLSFKDNAMVIDIGGIDIDIGDGVSVDIPAILQSLNPFSFKYGPSKYQLRKKSNNRNITVFFLNKDLHPGKEMSLYFIRISSKGKFLPREVAETIPFSSSNFSQIQHKLLIKPNSTKSEIMKSTVQECEEPAIEGEEKYCATSLEAMVDFITSKIGNKIRALSTEISTDHVKQQWFSINRNVRMVGTKMVVCHSKIYAYPVFYCHKMHNVKAYMVPLVGTSGSKVKAIAVCHGDTSKWNPMHPAFEVLKVKPGTVPVCHFLPADHILFAA